MDAKEFISWISFLFMPMCFLGIWLFGIFHPLYLRWRLSRMTPQERTFYVLNHEIEQTEPTTRYREIIPVNLQKDNPNGR